MKTTRRNFILTTAGGCLGALASGCASPDRTAKPTTKRTYDHVEHTSPVKCPGRGHPGCFYAGKSWYQHEFEPLYP
jgi:hypothetical protein